MRHKITPEDLVLARTDVQRGAVARAGRRLLAETVAACAAQEATLWLISPDGKNMEATLNHGTVPQIIEKLAVPVFDSVVGMVASSGLATSIGPGDKHNESIDKQTKVPVTAMIAAPVHVDAHICGVLSAINPTRHGDAGDAPVFPAEALDALEWKAFLMGLVLSAFVHSQ